MSEHNQSQDQGPQGEDDVLEKNVETLLASSAAPPRMDEAARKRVKAELTKRHGRVAPRRTRRAFVVGGLAAAAAAAAVIAVSSNTGDHGRPQATTDNVSEASEVPPQPNDPNRRRLADGSEVLLRKGATVEVLGPRRIRVRGGVLVDVVPGTAPFVVETDHGAMTVLGTRFVVEADADVASAAVIRGSVKIASDKGEVVVRAGERGEMRRGLAPTRGPAPRLSHLASWARELRREDGRARDPAVRNGTLFARDPNRQSDEVRLPMAELVVDAVVANQVARVVLDQTFTNPQNRELEGVYRFAIPADAALQRFAMYVDGTLTESAVVERMQARRVYEDLVYRRIDPGLLEYAGAGRLDLRVYPLRALQDKRLLLAYTQSLPRLYDDWSLVVPLPEVDAPVGKLSMRVRIEDCGACQVHSPSHDVTTMREGAAAVVTLSQAAARIGDSLVLTVRDPQPTARVARHRADGHQYLTVRARPMLASANREHRQRSWVILNDVSASRRPAERRAQADIVDGLLRELDEDDRVAVLAFDTAVQNLGGMGRVMDFDRGSVRDALLAQGSGGVGATDLGTALTAATQLLAGVAAEDARVVYLGDGVVTGGTRDLGALRAQVVGRAAFVGIGVGDGVELPTLRALADATGGAVVSMDLADDIGWRTFDLVAMLHGARVTGLRAVVVDNKGTPLPGQTSYLASEQLGEGDEVEVVARVPDLRAAAAAIELTGDLGGKPWRQRVELGAALDGGSAGYAPRLWAQRHIAARMLAKSDAPTCATSSPCSPEAAQAHRESIRKEVVALGKQHFLLSRHTSLLVLENDAMYAKYEVIKGRGDTWAPYAAPHKVSTATARPPEAGAVAVERVPRQRFSLQPTDWTGTQRWNTRDETRAAYEEAFEERRRLAAQAAQRPAGSAGRGAASPIASTGAAAAAPDVKKADAPATEFAAAPKDKSENKPERALGSASSSSTSLDVVSSLGDDGDETAAEQEVSVRGRFSRSPQGPARKHPAPSTALPPQLKGDWGHAGEKKRQLMPESLGDAEAHGLGYPAWTVHDPALADLSEFVPALFPDAVSEGAAALDAGRGARRGDVDGAARTLIERAQAAVAKGRYVIGGQSLVLGENQLSWTLRTPEGLEEHASFDGRQWRRAYPELGLSVTRDLGPTAPALWWAHLPFVMPNADDLAHWFVVRADGARAITLTVPGDSAPTLRVELDAQARIVAVRDEAGIEKIRVVWTGPAALTMTVAGITRHVTYAGRADAGPLPPEAAEVSLPLMPIATLQATRAALAMGTPTWAAATRGLIATAIAQAHDSLAQQAYAELTRANLATVGDVALASRALASLGESLFAAAVAPFAGPSRAVAAAAAPLPQCGVVGPPCLLGDKPYYGTDSPAIASATQPVVRYLVELRAVRAGRLASAVPAQAPGLVRTLSGYRDLLADVSGRRLEAAVRRLEELSIGGSGFATAAAFIIGQSADLPANRAPILRRAFAAATGGDDANVVRIELSRHLARWQQGEEAAQAVLAAMDKVDLSARPMWLDPSSHALVMQSATAAAQWPTAWRAYQSAIVGGGDVRHLVALAQSASALGDSVAVDRALGALAAKAGADRTALATLALSLGQVDRAAELVAPALQVAAPLQRPYRLAMEIATAQGQPDVAAGYLAAELALGRPISLAQLRSDSDRLIQWHAGAASRAADDASRSAALDAAVAAGARWRALDPDNDQIDQTLSALLLAHGRAEQAWRHLSTVIERRPMDGGGYMIVGDAQAAAGHPELAAMNFRQAMLLDQTNPGPRLRLIDVLIQLGRDHEADDILRQAVAVKWHDRFWTEEQRLRDLATRRGIAVGRQR